MNVKKKITYKTAGVDIDKTDSMVKTIKRMCQATERPEVIGKIGNFSGFFGLPNKKYSQPVLVSSTDGVGTKLIVSIARNEFTTIGIDLVAMCVNDLITCGAEPLFFLDYFASGKVKPKHFFDVLKGIVNGCRQSHCSLVGGEIAEMPDCYSDDKYDLAGFAVGVIDRKKIIDGSKVKKGDIAIGLASTGLHSNGYSLARKVFTDSEIKKSEWGKELLKPTRIYVKPILKLCESLKLKSIAHITGGGLYDNVPRVLPKNLSLIIDKKAWKVPSIFNEIQKRTSLPDREMYRTFNMGIGMVVIVAKNDVTNAMKIIKNFRIPAYILGEVISGKNSVEIE